MSLVYILTSITLLLLMRFHYIKKGFYRIAIKLPAQYLDGFKFAVGLIWLIALCITLMQFSLISQLYTLNTFPWRVFDTIIVISIVMLLTVSLRSHQSIKNNVSALKGWARLLVWHLVYQMMFVVGLSFIFFINTLG